MYLIFNSLKFILKDLLLEIIYFPVWWYTQGAFMILKKIMKEAKSFAHNLNLGILSQYLFKSMYGMTDIWSRIISFMVRIVQFIILGFIFIIWLLILIALFFAWLLLPIFIIYNILYQLGIINKLFFV